MNEEILAEELIKENEYYMVKFIDHTCIEVSTNHYPELATCDFKKLQKIMGKHQYIIQRVIDTKEEYIKEFKNPYNRFLVYRATVKI